MKVTQLILVYKYLCCNNCCNPKRLFLALIKSVLPYNKNNNNSNSNNNNSNSNNNNSNSNNNKVILVSVRHFVYTFLVQLQVVRTLRKIVISLAREPRHVPADNFDWSMQITHPNTARARALLVFRSPLS